MSVIFCKLNLFDAKQTILRVDDLATAELASVEMKDLGDTIATLCNEEGISHVTIQGNLSYADSIADDIRTVSQTKYANSNINIDTMEIEVIE